MFAYFKPSGEVFLPLIAVGEMEFALWQNLSTVNKEWIITLIIFMVLQAITRIASAINYLDLIESAKETLPDTERSLRSVREEYKEITIALDFANKEIEAGKKIMSSMTDVIISNKSEIKSQSKEIELLRRSLAALKEVEKIFESSVSNQKFDIPKVMRKTLNTISDLKSQMITPEMVKDMTSALKKIKKLKIKSQEGSSSDDSSDEIESTLIDLSNKLEGLTQMVEESQGSVIKVDTSGIEKMMSEMTTQMTIVNDAKIVNASDAAANKEIAKTLSAREEALKNAESAFKIELKVRTDVKNMLEAVKNQVNQNNARSLNDMTEKFEKTQMFLGKARGLAIALNKDEKTKGPITEQLLSVLN
jgi:hypothetical protein